MTPLLQTKVFQISSEWKIAWASEAIWDVWG